MAVANIHPIEKNDVFKTVLLEIYVMVHVYEENVEILRTINVDVLVEALLLDY